MTVFLAMVYGQAQSAAFKGNTSAFDKLVTILEAEENDSRDILFELPARVLAKSFVDVSRMITAREYSEYVFKGGRLATKSSFIALKIIEIVKQNPTFHALAVRPFENTLHEIQSMPVRCGRYPNSVIRLIGNSPVQCSAEYLPTGQRIYLRGADDPGKIKSRLETTVRSCYSGVVVRRVDQFRGEEQIRDVTQSAIRGGDVGYVLNHLTLLGLGRAGRTDMC